MANIQKMNRKAEANNLIFRPHFKTHQNIHIAKWFREFDITTCTVSSVNMAKHLAAESWNDIFIGFPLDINELEEIDRLASKIDLTVLVNDKAHLEALEKLENKVGFMIEIDAGYHRSGIDFRNHELVIELINQSVGIPQANFKGLASHFGNSYLARDAAQIMGIGLKSINRLVEMASKIERLLGQYVFISIGDTPTASVMSHFPKIDELRPGNFIFYDLMQLQIGSCRIEDISAYMQCSVVSKNYAEKQVIIHGGAVHFSKEYIDFLGVRSYGHIIKIDGQNWELTSNFITSLSQEHGIVQCTDEDFDIIQIGDYLSIIPVHSCLTANLMKENIVFE